MSKRAAVYARVSTDEQGRGYSLPTQLEACREYAERRGFTIAGEFTDEFTGTSLDRPGLDQLRDLIATDNIQAIIIYDLDRLSRRAIHQMLLEEEFAKAGLETHYVLGQYDNTPEGRLQKQIKGAIAEYERAKIEERLKRGL
jgi:site-specific DNA recombinase